MEVDTLMGILGFLVFVGLFFGIGLGIYYMFKDNIIEPKKKKEKNQVIADFKFNLFIEAVSSLFPSSKRIVGDESEIIFNEKISNGIEDIGSFIYSIKDDIQTTQNSVGTVKLHNYIILVGFKIKPDIKYSLESDSVNILNVEYCKETLHFLKTKLLHTQLYIDAIDVNKIN